MSPLTVVTIVTVQPAVAGLFEGRAVVWPIVTLLFAAVGIAAWTAISTVSARGRTLERALRPYVDQSAVGAPAGARDASATWIGAETTISQHAVDVAEELARQQGVLAAIERRLDQAGIDLRPGEVLFFGAASAVLAGVLVGLLVAPLPGLVCSVIVALLVIVVVQQKGKRRLRRFVSQLPDTLNLLSGTLKAGYSLLQGVTAVAQEVEEPMGGELRRILIEAQLGRPIEDALEASAARMASPDFAWAVMGINIQREVGGNLAELLSTIAQTMTGRERLRREVKGLTAEGRMSAILLGGLPPGLGAIMFAVNPTYIGKLFSTGIGQTMVAIGSVWALIGFFAMKKIVTVEE